MKILIICTQVSGGAGKACLRQHQALLAAGMDSRLLVLEANETQGIPNLSLFQTQGRWLNKIQQFWRTRRYFSARRRALAKRPTPPEPFQFLGSPYRVEEHPWCDWADVIHLHWVARFVHEASFFSSLKHKTLFWTLHDCLPFTGGWHYEQGFPHGAYGDLLGKQAQAKQKIMRPELALNIIYLSRWLGHLSKNSPILGHYPHHHIPNSVPTHIFKAGDKAVFRQALDLPQDKALLLFVAESAHNPRKGFELLRQALQLIPADAADLVVIGHWQGPKDFDERLHLLGSIRDERLLRMVYAACDVFVAPSIEDNLPNTVVEALCCGLPCLGFAIGGMPDLIEHQGLGILVKTLNAQALALGITTALNTDFKPKEIAAFAQEKYSPEKQALSLKECYIQALSHKK